MFSAILRRSVAVLFRSASQSCPIRGHANPMLCVLLGRVLYFCPHASGTGRDLRLFLCRLDQVKAVWDCSHDFDTYRNSRSPGSIKPLALAYDRYLLCSFGWAACGIGLFGHFVTGISGRQRMTVPILITWIATSAFFGLVAFVIVSHTSSFANFSHLDSCVRCLGMKCAHHYKLYSVSCVSIVSSSCVLPLRKIPCIIFLSPRLFLCTYACIILSLLFPVALYVFLSHLNMSRQSV